MRRGLIRLPKLRAVRVRNQRSFKSLFRPNPYLSAVPKGPLRPYRDRRSVV
jgi:hypothetical protein